MSNDHIHLTSIPQTMNTGFNRTFHRISKGYLISSNLGVYFIGGLPLLKQMVKLIYKVTTNIA